MSQNRIKKWDEINGDGNHEERWEAFLETANNSYAIFQLSRSDETIDEWFLPLSVLQKKGKEPEFDHYEVVYIAPLEPYTHQMLMLEKLYEKFNLYRPEDFKGHSLSVSDIVALKQNGVISCHYVDRFGFTELKGFLKPENYLKNAEMELEDDYGMLDGIVNNGQVPAKEEKTSVLEKLKEQSGRGNPKKSSKSPLEREME